MDKVPGISVLMKPASGSCNLSCDYCFYCDETANRERGSYGYMSTETLRNVIRKTLPHALHTVSYAYQGGEPMLRGLDFYRKAVEYQKQYNHRGIQIINAFQTNGSLLNEAWCEFFSQNRFLVGVSVDGIEETHNACRHTLMGGRTYEKVVAGIKQLNDYKVDFNILTVVNRKTVNRITEIYRDYRQRGWRYQQYILCLDPLYSQRGESPYSVSPEAYGYFLIQLFRLWYQDWQAGNQPYIRQFENLVGMVMGYPPEACEQLGTCGIQYVVEADGSVFPCDFYALDPYQIGNFNQDRLRQIDDLRDQIRFVDLSRQLPPECLTCEYYKLCRCGCRRQRDEDPAGHTYRFYYCESFKMFFKACGKELKQIAQSIQNGDR